MAQRPASRASNATRPASRASTLLAEAAPVTPHRPAAPSVARFGGFSAKQVDRISETIASVSRKRTAATKGRFSAAGGAIEEEDELDHGAAGRYVTGRGRRRPALFLHTINSGSWPQHAAPVAPNGTFLRGASFSAAPLNSRVPTLSPRKQPSRLPPEEGLSSSEDDGALEELTASGKLRSRAKGKARAIEEKEDLPKLSREVQEALLVEDLLFVLMGIPGTYIELDPEYEPEDGFERLQGARFVVDPTIDPSLGEVVERILPLATYYTSILEFTEVENHIDYGLVNHALCAAIRDVLREYLELLAQLEHQFNTAPNFTLQRLWFYVHPTLHTLSLLHALTSELTQLNCPLDDDEESDSETDEALKAVLASTSTGPSGRGSGLAKGGEVLAILDVRVARTAGDPAAKALYEPLLLRASQPYAKMLLQWVTTGHLDDPHDEFMVKETKGITRSSLEMDFTDEYWEKKYVLKGGKRKDGDGGVRLSGGAVVPTFLEAWKGKILLAGKYVNVMRECGTELDSSGSGERPERAGKEGEDLISMDDEAFFRKIQDAYTLANRSLLSLLVTTHDFPGRLRSLRHHFFVAQGDAFTSFLDAAGYELSKRVKSVNVARLQSQFDLAVRNPASSSGGDPYKEDVKVSMATTTLTDWLLKVVAVTGAIGTAEGEGMEAMAAGIADLAAGGGAERDPTGAADGKKDGFTGIDALQLDYTVRFPLSLVISRKTILRYQLIFRHLLHLKHLEQSLASIWMEHIKTPAWREPTPYTRLRDWKRRVFVLRAKMLGWVQQMYSFASVEVLEKGWRNLQAKLDKVETVDGLLKDHVDFLDTCLKECMLTNARLLKLHQQLFTTCSVFAKHSLNFTSTCSQLKAALEAADGDFEALPDKARDRLDTAEKNLAKFEKKFGHHSKVHLDTITYFASSENLALLALVVRLSNIRSVG